MKATIVKLQIPISSNAEPVALVYDRTRKIQGVLDISEELLEIMNGRPKAFFYADMAKDGALEFHDEAPWQEW